MKLHTPLRLTTILLKIIISIKVLFITIPHSYGAPSGSNDKFALDLGAIYLSQRVYHGALIWPAASTIPMIGFVFNGKYAVHGPNISVFKKLGPLRFRMGTSFFDDGEPWIKLESHSKDHRNQRSMAIDLYQQFDFRFMPGGKLTFRVSKELVNHHGIYGYGSLQLPLFPFFSGGYSVGYGGSRSNRYTYGPEGRAGLGHQDVYVSLMIPFLPFGGMWLTKFTMSRIHLDENKTADYIRGDDKVNVLMSFVKWRI